MFSKQVLISLFVTLGQLFFFIIFFSKQLEENKSYQWLDLDRRPLVSHATVLPTEPQPLPNFSFLALGFNMWTISFPNQIDAIFIR